MEIILVTPNPKYQTLVSATKIIESSNVDITTIIETEVFLNHHYNISFYCIRNNFPYQFHSPLKISKLLLDRNEGSVELYISNGLYFKIQTDTDALEVFSNVQNSLQGFQSQQNVVFTLKYWEIQIRLIVLNQVYQQRKIKQAITLMQQTNNQSLGQALPNMNINLNLGQGASQFQMQQINKLILYIDENNYEQFLGWSENQSIIFNYQINEKLSNQYMSLKQQIDNQKNLFRNKIKMVQAILGENINIDKLLTEQKQENQEYKRLRETFQTIKNIDNVLIQQEKRLEFKSKELKEKRAEKHRIHYENAKIFAKEKNQIACLIKQIEQLKYKCDCVSRNKVDYQSRRNFQPNKKIKEKLIQQQNRCKQIIKNVQSFQNDQIKKNQKQQEIPIKKRIIQSLHKCEKKQMQSYQNLLRYKARKFKKQKQNTNQLTNKDRITEQTHKYENILYHLSKFYQTNNHILSQVRDHLQKSNKDSPHKHQNTLNCPTENPKYTISVVKRANIPKKIEWGQQYVVLRQILQNNPKEYIFRKNNGASISVTNKVQSCASIQKNGSPEQQRQKQKQKQREREKQKDKNLQKEKLQGMNILNKKIQKKNNFKPTFQVELKKKPKNLFNPQQQKNTITLNK